ncbi:MAG: amidohydrolase family protein [Alphaproteobacteria bacterium]|nr:amidohydrolase family protein [Alphaproteobacteria bacterium]
MGRIVIRTAWTIADVGGRQVPLPEHAIVVEGDRIADVTREPPRDAETIDLPGGIACPGIANLHNHTINGPLFRGIVDDLPRRAIGESKVYSVLMPMGSLAMTWLTEEQRRDLVALGLLEVLRSGATTMVDQFRPPQRVILELARDWGLRLYGAPYLFSPAKTIADPTVARATQGSFEGASGLDAFEAMFREFDDGERGRMRVILGPHAADSCAPDLLQRVDAIARERKLLATIHLAQSQGEVDRVAADRGMGPAAYMKSVGLLREGVVYAHGTHLTDDELDRIADAGAAVANCASVFLRGGKSPNFQRFKSHGVRVGFGTDAERMDMFAQLRATGFASKQAFGMGDAATAAELLQAATAGAADILRRPDLGRIARGMTADLLLVDAMKPHLQPIRDPVRTLVWYAGAADVDTILIGGRAVVRGRRAVGLDEPAIVRRGAEATRALWDEAKRRGHFPAEAEPAQP